MTYILDACALIAVFNLEPGAAKVRELLMGSLSTGTPAIMSPVNLTEVYYDRARVVGLDKANEIYSWIKAALFIPESINDGIIQEAGRLKSRYKMSLGDAYGLATAVEYSGSFVTADHHELDLVEQNESIPFFWFR